MAFSIFVAHKKINLMGTTRIAINGFGRIGRVFLRALLEQNKNIEVVAINDLTDTKTLAHLFKYDSVHRKFSGTVAHGENDIEINGKKILAFKEKDPANLPWKDLAIDIVIESTGFFLTKEGAGKHLQAGAKRVIISAPAADADIKTVVLGCNAEILDSKDQIISNASCTTNCASPMLKVLNDNWGIEYAFVNTVHSYTGDQRLHDAPHKDLRRARAAAVSIIPTTTGAGKAISKIFPHLEGKIGGTSVRVPVPDGSLTEITCEFKKNITVAELNEAFKKAAAGELKGILEYSDEPLVSIDIVGNPHSCIFDSESTHVLGNMVKIIGWYDNECGYSNRLVDLVQKISTY